MSNYFRSRLDEILEGAAPSAPPKPGTKPPRQNPQPERRQWPSPKHVPQPKNTGAAPAKPVPAPRPGTKPPRPEPERRNWPNPKHVPQPKNQNEARHRTWINIISEAVSDEDYEREVHPSTRNFWGDLPKNKQHLFGSHPLLAMFGKDLSRESWKFTRDRAENVNTNMRALFDIMQRIIKEESRHRDELIDLAKKVTVQIWNVPEEMLNAQLTQSVDVNETPEDEQDTDFSEPFEAEAEAGAQGDMQAHVNKRVTLNLMTHGAAVHQMLTMHHLVNKEIEAISPRLLDLYNQVSAGSHAMYWLWNIPQMLDHIGASAIGSEHVEYPEPDEEGNRPDEPPIVQAKAWIFPVLCQELSKGVAEVASHFADTPREAAVQADDIRHEPYMIQVGPDLWRRFNKVRPKNIPLFELMRAFAECEDPTRLMMAVIEDPDSPDTQQMLDALIQNPAGFDEHEYLDDKNEDEGLLDGDEADFEQERDEWEEDPDAWKNGPRESRNKQPLLESLEAAHNDDDGFGDFALGFTISLSIEDDSQIGKGVGDSIDDAINDLKSNTKKIHYPVFVEVDHNGEAEGYWCTSKIKLRKLLQHFRNKHFRDEDI